VSLVSTSSVVYRGVPSGGGTPEGRGVVVKWPRTPDRRHLRELTFYGELSQRVSSFVPEFYGGGAGSDGEPAYLVLSDCSPQYRTYPMDVTPPGVVTRLVRCLAALHARMWGQLHVPDVFEPTEDDDGFPSATSVADAIAAWEGMLAQADLDLIRRIAETSEDLRARMSSASVLLHGDYHQLNVLLSSRSQVVIDWQDACSGHPARDLAKFIAAYVHPLDRVRWGPEWIDLYFHELCLNGVDDYRYADFVADYRTALVLAVLTPVAWSRIAGLSPDGVLLRAKHILLAAREVLDDGFVL
jgi:aminoglycoside phosphotransferase (APT) family kinase protein